MFELYLFLISGEKRENDSMNCFAVSSEREEMVSGKTAVGAGVLLWTCVGILPSDWLQFLLAVNSIEMPLERAPVFSGKVTMTTFMLLFGPRLFRFDFQ